MKKIFGLVFSLLLIFTLFSCKSAKRQEIVIFLNNEAVKILEETPLKDIEIELPAGKCIDYFTVDGNKVDSDYKVKKNDIIRYFFRLAKYYTVHFTNIKGGTLDYKYKVIKENDKVEKPDLVLNEHYILNSWLLNGKTFDFNTPITSDITLSADISYKENYPEFTVNVDIRGVVTQQKIHFAADLEIDIIATMNENTIFDKWNVDNYATIKNGDTIKAVFRERKTFFVLYDNKNLYTEFKEEVKEGDFC